MKKSLGSAIGGIALMVGVMLLILKKGVWGAGLVFIFLAVLLYGVTFASELWKLIHGNNDGKNVRGRDRNA